MHEQLDCHRTPRRAVAAAARCAARTSASDAVRLFAAVVIATFLVAWPCPSLAQGSNDWTFCAPEGGFCAFNGTAEVRYGANGSFVYQTLTNGTACTNGVFGDPIYGTAKQCAIRIVPTDWMFCAAEGGVCAFAGTMQVRYGANGSFFFETLTDGTACTNEVFGDPIPGTVKQCAIRPPEPTEWTFCAPEGGFCAFAGRAEVRYGANGSFVNQTLTDGTACTNQVFGDPIPGTVKQCAIRPSEPTEWTFCAPEGGVCAFTGTTVVRYGANGFFVYQTLTDGTACTNQVFGDPIPGTAKLCAINAPPSTWGPSLAYASGRQLLLQRRLPNGHLGSPEPFVMRGVTWSPASRTTATTPSDPQNANRRRPEFGIWYNVDIPLMRAMRVNTVRLFIDPGFDATLGPIGLRVLDELYRNGIMVVMTVDDAINDLVRVQGAVQYYRRHPAILMWSLGSEWNINGYFRGWPPLYAAQRTEIAAQLVKSLDQNHPVVSSYGEIDIPATGLRLADTTNYVQTVVPSVDVWSLNLYRGNTFDDTVNRSVFAQWLEMSTKPMFIGEFGIDAFHGRCLSNPPSGSVNEGEQATWNLDLWNDITRNLSAADPLKAAVGGTVFEWSDEWWKAGSFTTQDTGGWTSDGFPDWHGTEEYFGLVDIDRVPRAAYFALASAFEPGHVPPAHTITFRAISRGANMCGPQANFRRDGHTFYQRTGGGGGGRGINVAVADAATGEILDLGRNFDTWGGGDPAKLSLMNYLNAVSAGRVVMLAVADEAGITVGTGCTLRTDATTVALVQLLQSLGSTRIDEYCWRGSWAMVTIKGTGSALAEDYFRTEEARAEPALPVPE